MPTKTNGLRRFGGNRPDDLFNTTTFALLDTDLKFIAHTETLLSQVKALLIEWGDLFLLTLDGKVAILPRVFHGKSANFYSSSGTMRNLYSKS